MDKQIAQLPKHPGDRFARTEAERAGTQAAKPAETRALKLSRRFTPIEVEPGDECFPNGIFVFNITKMSAFINAHPGKFPVEWVDLREIPSITRNGKDKAAIERADLSKPAILAEISPNRFNLIDGHHRLARARREGREAFLAVRISAERHTAFLTTRTAYEAYVAYWNEKLTRKR